MKKKTRFKILLFAVLLTVSISLVVLAGNRAIGINVVLNTSITDAILADISNYGKVLKVFYEINALTLRAKENVMNTIQSLPYVEAANPDAERYAGPVDTVAAEDFLDGRSTWNLDAINVTDFGFNNRQVVEDGEGVYVAVLDTGLLKSWRQYLPQERIAEEYAVCFGGGGGEMGYVSAQPNKWERDTDSHGTHVSSTIIGYSLGGTPINGVAPMAKIIPVKVLNQVGWGWSSVIARGIVYIADLKANELAASPVVINMSLSGPVLDAIEKAAIDYAIGQGVIIVASAGNQGEAGMGYPGAYEPVISVAAAGWINEWTHPSWWWWLDVADPTNPNDFYIVDFSSWEKPLQDLDVTAPGSWVVGPYQLQMGQISYYYLGGTSMASPHVAGIVALMAQKFPNLTATGADFILETTALYIPGWGPEAQGAGMVDAAAALLATPTP